jgi:hypothetical protein
MDHFLNQVKANLKGEYYVGKLKKERSRNIPLGKRRT